MNYPSRGRHVFTNLLGGATMYFAVIVPEFSKFSYPIAVMFFVFSIVAGFEYVVKERNLTEN